MCPTGRLSSVGTLARPGEAACARLFSSLSQKTGTVPAPQKDARFRNHPAGHFKIQSPFISGFLLLFKK